MTQKNPALRRVFCLWSWSWVFRPGFAGATRAGALPPHPQDIWGKAKVGTIFAPCLLLVHINTRAPGGAAYFLRFFGAGGVTGGIQPSPAAVVSLGV